MLEDLDMEKTSFSSVINKIGGDIVKSSDMEEYSFWFLKKANFFLSDNPTETSVLQSICLI